MNILRIAGVFAFAAVSTSVSESDVCACAPAMRTGDAVRVAEESALIFWDAAHKTQHFIRRAEFDTKARDFGFLVPTPSRPALSEVDDAIFGHLLELTKPPVRRDPPRSTANEQIASAAAAPEPAKAPPVRVLETVTVAGLDAAVLAANDAKALNKWLQDHGYSSGAALAEWFKPYIEAKWIITAFKISKGVSRSDRAMTSAVRMSFNTDRPFFPYREPATRDSSPRALEVYLVSSERVEGGIGKAGTWPGRTLWAQPLSASARDGLLKRAKLPANAAPARAWLTRFLDSSAPRPGTDELYFSRSSDQAQFMDEDRLHAELARKESARWAVADTGPVAPKISLLEQGQAAEQSGNIKGAVRLYVRAVRAGEFEAAKLLGDIFATGKGDVERDFAEAQKYHGLAEKNGIKIERRAR